MAQSIFDLPPPERFRRLRELALEARQTANHPDMVQYRASFLKIAEQWERMALELEELEMDEARKPDVPK